MVSSDVGMMGGAEAHEYQYLTAVGEDHVVVCKSCGYNANIDAAKHKLSSVSEPTSQRVEEVYTPGCKDNKNDHHLKNVDPRSFTGTCVDDLSLPTEQSLCVVCDSPLSQSRGIEVGNIFKLGEKYSRLMGATYLDNRGTENFLVMGCYGIGIGRTIACIVEQHSDERGIIWPKGIAPYAIHILALGNKTEVTELAESLYADLQKAGLEVLYDDREQTPGVKFGDADLLGMPIQVVVSKRSIDAGGVEVRLRKESNSKVVPYGAVLEALKAHINVGD
ncbi:MAG: prolyl-tRNA synthetase [Bacillota bacterium]|nr:MAG: prolyl-tRNA synthetase [Bacillota bacterium]